MLLNRKQKESRRKNARKHIIEIWERCGKHCFYCKKPIFPIKLIQKQFKILKISAHHVIYEKENIIVKSLFATIDHIDSLAEGGGNIQQNLVISCSVCNKNKDRELSSKQKNPSKECQCGRWKNHTEEKCIRCSCENSTLIGENIAIA